MKHMVFTGIIAAILAGCGVKGDPVRENGTRPPVVATSSISDGKLTPSKPRDTLF